MKTFIQQLFKDKHGHFSLREFAVALFIIALITSWIAQQFFGKPIPEYMFYTFATMIGAGCFGYSLEKNIINPLK